MVPGVFTPETMGNAPLAEKQYESNILAVLLYYCSALIVTVLTRQLHVVVVRWSVLLESTF